MDEILPAPWEWDVKRLAASFVIACRDNGIGHTCGADAARACAQSYRDHIVKYGDMRVLDVWYFATVKVWPVFALSALGHHQIM
jgi:uncharacterized protein (DUF2252 family)